MLRTDAAIKGIARKANSRKYTQLWPKPVLEALDEAIRENHWETALKVCGFWWFVCVLDSGYLELIKLVSLFCFLVICRMINEKFINFVLLFFIFG